MRVSLSLSQAATLVGVLLAGSTLVGCDKSCQSSCRKIYETSECGLEIAGRTPEVSIRECASECEAALKQTGDVGTYDPYQPGNPTIEVKLENEKQAAAWMDCVADATCDQLDSANGICQPI